MFKNRHNSKKNLPTSLRWKILFPIWWMIVLILLAILITSQIVVTGYVNHCIEDEMESISNAAREIIEREYIYSEQPDGYEDIYRLARKMVASLNTLPRHIITTNYDIRFIVHTTEMNLHFVTSDLADSEEERSIGTEITEEILKLVQDEGMKENNQLFHRFFIGETQYFTICMPLRLQRVTGVEDAYLISYVNTSSQNNVVIRMNRGLTMIMLVAFLVAIFISWYIAQRLSDPLRRLCEYAETIGKLDFQRKDLDSGIRELDELATEMDHMASQLAEYDANQKKFLLNISHDLRTPLTSIKGYAESIYYEVTDDPKHAANTILKESQHLEQMVENLLFVSRMDMAEDRFMFETLDFVQAVRDVKERMQVQFTDRGCAVELDLPNEPVLIFGDEMHLSRALMNIFSNSLRYVKEKITVKLKIQENQAILSISDDGPGFSEEDLKNLFERFYKGEKGNFGVGMSIVKMVVERMGGKVNAGNLECSGAVVTICFPVLELQNKTEITVREDI